MQIFKIRSVTLQPLALVSFVPSFIKMRFKTTEKQFKQKLTDN